MLQTIIHFTNMTQKSYKVIRPETFGLPPKRDLVFVQTTNGYVASISADHWIGMPSYLIEGNPQLFKYQRKHFKKNGTNKTTVGGNGTPKKTN